MTWVRKLKKKTQTSSCIETKKEISFAGMRRTGGGKTKVGNQKNTGGKKGMTWEETKKGLVMSATDSTCQDPVRTEKKSRISPCCSVVLRCRKTMDKKKKDNRGLASPAR